MNLKTLFIEKKARRIKNETIKPTNKPKKTPYSLKEDIENSPCILVGETKVFFKYKSGGESLESLLLKHFISVVNAEK